MMKIDLHALLYNLGTTHKCPRTSKPLNANDRAQETGRRNEQMILAERLERMVDHRIQLAIKAWHEELRTKYGHEMSMEDHEMREGEGGGE
eukprot:9467388-Pyramimonas_sp.AAC.1